MKFLRTLTILAFAVSVSTGVVLAEEKKSEAPKYSPGSCCDKAAKDGKTCEHPCCVAAAKDSKVCKKCNKPGKKCE
ncbi:MAG: hypothetical protein HZA91_14325 [Verrucomicrobia bacterium]|nr:hypothetical protein [Verrucomicrobiota bacterium]